MRKLQCVNGRPSFSGRMVAVATMTAMSPSLIRRGTAARPPRVQRGQPLLVEQWITSRTVSPSSATSHAIAGTGVPDADAMMIIARRTRIDPCLPRRTTCCSRCPS